MSTASRVTGLIGWPVAHSLSPAIHGYWMRQYKIEGSYELFPAEPDQLENAVKDLRKRHIFGFNVTVPYKEAIMALLDGVDLMAEEIGAVNTVLVEKNEFLGTNTDAYGFITNLREGADLEKHLGHVVLLGAGGAARAAIVALQQAGARHMSILNRTHETAEMLAAEFRLQAKPWESRAKALKEATLLVNSTSLGMLGKPPLELALDALPERALVTDMVYAPLETELLKAARKRGNPTVDGLGMLLHQAAEAFRLWHKVKPEVTAELRAQILREAA